jgi:hypothetical protein
MKPREFTSEDFATMHVGRHWPGSYKQGQRGTRAGQTIEDECPCPTEPCGLVARDKIDPECPQHGLTREKTIRSSHRSAECPERP